MPTLDSDLVRRYDRRGPRYTSYPSAASFDRATGIDQFKAAINRSNEDLIPSALGLYIHIPFCHTLCYYCGCTKIVTPHTEKAGPYLERVLEESARIAPLLDPSRTIRELHLGGGTPSFVSPAALAEFINSLGQRLPLDREGDQVWSIEIDPRSVTVDDISALAAMGFKRMSFGVQDLDPEVQAAVNRILPAKQVAALTRAARAAGVGSINFDLIYGLPRQNPPRFRHTLEQIVDIAPDRLALYGYAHLPQLFKSQRMLPEADLPQGEKRLALITNAIEQLGAAGYEYIGMDHFALPGDELARARREGHLIRNFQGYAVGPYRDLLGLGMSAISSVDDVYAQNAKTLTAYYQAIDSGTLAIERGYRLSRDDLIRRSIIQAIMCQDEIDLTRITEHYEIDAMRYFATELQALSKLEADGLIDGLLRGSFRITRRGRLLLRVIAMVFDTHSSTRASDKVVSTLHSRVI